MLNIKTILAGQIVYDLKKTEYTVVKIQRGGVMGARVKLKFFGKAKFRTISESQFSQFFTDKNEIIIYDFERQQRVLKFLNAQGVANV